MKLSNRLRDSAGLPNYLIESELVSVEAPHTYFVSIRGVLTHNIVLPAIDCVMNIPWDMVFTAGGQLALQLGPATCGISIAVAAGAGIGYAIYQLSKGSAEISTYGVDFNVEGINTYFSKKGRRSLGNDNNSSTHSGSCSSGAPHGPKDPKKRNTDKVGNMHEFFEREGFGQELKAASEFTNETFKGARVFRVTSNLARYGLKKGDLFYLDTCHFDHLEVFNNITRRCRMVLNLNGSYNSAKTLDALVRRLPKR